MAGNQLHANSQLMYYPTLDFETYRMLGILGKIQIGKDTFERNYLIEQIKKDITESKYRELLTVSADNDVSIDYILYDYYLQNLQYDKINKYFKYEIFSSKAQDNIVIADLQSGEGEWLNTFKTFIPYNQQQTEIKYMSNELEEKRYKECIKKSFNYTYLGSFEELQIPKQSVSLLLFNPPYGEDNGERMVKKFLRLTIERQMMANGGYIVMVIRKDDALDIAELLNKYCFVYNEIIYKVNAIEYDKFKQYVIIARMYSKPLYDDTKIHSASMLESIIQRYKKVIESEPEFDIKNYNNKIVLPSINVNELMENFEYIQGNNKKISSNDNVWKWIKELTELKDLGSEKLILPKQPKTGEIANLLASGYINGNIDLNGKATHIAVGGTRSVEKKEVEKFTDDKGDKITQTKIIKYSKPYLNILIQKDGKLQIKELGGDND